MRNLYQNLHTEVYNAIKAHSAVSAITSNVYDGLPVQLLRGKGYPMVIVNSPLGSENLFTIGKTSYNGILTMSVFVISTQQSIARQLADAVREAVFSSSFSSAELMGIQSSREQVNIRKVQGSKKELKEWVIILELGFEVVGSW